MELYRDIDVQAITDNLDKIINSANEVRNKILEPTLEECNKFKEVIKKYIFDKKRIIYGGTAYDEIIKNKNKEDRIYSDSDCKDIEFYTPKPIEDLVELCNILHEKKFKYVIGKQAAHAETYTIFVNFLAICDISYMSLNIYLNMPTLNINGFEYSHPTWILVDIFRQYNDPIISYWRLKDKTFCRANRLLKNFPLELSNEEYKVHEKMGDEKKNILNNIIRIETIIFVGTVAENYYITRSKKIDSTTLECYSTNYKEDIKIINNIIKNVLNNRYNNIQINIYRPFFQFRDEWVEFIIDNTVLIKVYKSNNKCIPYNTLYIQNNEINKIQIGGFLKKSTNEEINIKIGTFIFLLNHVLIERQYLYVNRNKNYKGKECIMLKLLEARNDYLNKNAITVMDNSPYKEFIVQCIGKTIDQGREFRLKIEKRKGTGVRLVFSYDPSIQQDNFKIPEYKFNNTSGNLNKNKINKYFE
jgi:hypothetical protein